MGRRDSRADLIDDDPFSPSYRAKSRVRHIHQRTDEQGTIHFDTKSPGNQLPPAFAQFFGQQAWQPPSHHTGPLWHFSKEEKAHLRQAMGAFTLALGFMSVGGISGLGSLGLTKWSVYLLLSMPVMFVAIGPAFLLHEIGHKLVAKKNGCWAEFRADPKGLQMGIFLALLLGFLFMAPGAVMVAGMVTRRQNGHIAVAGPLTNLGLFIIGIPLWGVVLGLSGAFETLPLGISTQGLGQGYLLDGSLVWQAMLIDVGVYWLGANLFLGLFNMLPFGPLDGLKVKDWNETAFYAVILIFAVPLLTMFLGFWTPTGVLLVVAEPVSNLVR